MLPNLCFSLDKLLPRKNKGGDGTKRTEPSGWGLQHRPSMVCNNRKPTTKPARFPLRSERRERNEEIEVRKREMVGKVSNISDLIHRVATSCLTQHPASAHGFATGDGEEMDESVENQKQGLRIWEDGNGDGVRERVREMEGLMAEVFEAVSAVKRAYVSLQEAHCHWDPDKIQVADAAVVAELRRLGRLRDRFRRGVGVASVAATPLRDAVAPYEAALDDLKRVLQAKQAEVESLKEKLCKTAKKGRPHYGKRVGCITGLAPPSSPSPEMFEACMEQVQSASKTFTTHLLSLMRAARWDIAAAVRSIIEGDGAAARPIPVAGTVDPGHARYALESYVNRRVFQGFENETFYMDGTTLTSTTTSTSALTSPKFRQDCFAQFRDMRGMDPAELLGILPTCQFGRFAAMKYLAVVHPRMEESLFGGVEQRREVVAGAHPRTGFYGEFLRVAKAVWLLHLLAFALDPAPSHFEAGKGVDFHPEYMESVVRFAGGRVPSGMVVGFSVGPGFKLGNGSVVRARVYLVPSPRAL